MKIAVLISGYLRSFKVNLPKTIGTLKNTFEDIDIYFHITEDEELEDRYLNFNDYEIDIPFIIDKFDPKSLIIEKNHLFSEIKSKNSLYNTWYKFYKLNKLKILQEKIDGTEYDYVIKLRPDIEIIDTDLNNIFDEDFICIPEKNLVDKSKLTNPEDNFICDTMAFGSSSLMNEYFDIFNHLDELTNTFGHVSETILFEYLNSFEINHKTISLDYNVILSECNVFAICGDSGSGKSTLSDILKNYFNKSFVLECDRYHKWDRHDTNWEKYTHLNPESNFLTKMSEDIFNLKLGKEILQVDYDHKTGKFTDKEAISSSNNLIVCGLHSLYNENKDVYNLKIFIDTDERLKTHWKILRDVNIRNKNLEDVIKQIETRKTDYEKYILPQRDQSDIVINFYPIQDDLTNIGLNINVKKERNISDLVFKLNRFDIDMKTDENDKFYIFNFEKFTPIDLGIYPHQNNFYDYIVYFIFNLKS